MIDQLPGIQTLRYFETLISTQNYAAEHLTELVLPALILADTQTAGFGQKQRVWESPAGNLYFTLVLKPSGIKIEHLAFINVACGLALQTTLAEVCSLNCMIKWPNDLYYQGKKLCGLLSEYKHDTLLIGVGLNVNTVASDYSTALQTICTSIQSITGLEQNREALLSKLIANMLLRIEHLNTHGTSQLIDDFEKLSGFVGAQVNFFQNDVALKGKVIGLSPLGCLQVADSNNYVYELISGDVTLCY